MKRLDVLPAATRLIDELSPFCERIQLAGSLLREEPEVSDIDIVCIPVKIREVLPPADMFSKPESRLVVHPEFVRIVNSYQKIKGEPTGKLTVRLVPLTLQKQDQSLSITYIKAEISMTQFSNFGYILAIRTGSLEFSKRLAALWCSKGLQGNDGHLTKKATGRAINLPEEKDLFRLLGIQYVEPKLRHA